MAVVRVVIFSFVDCTPRCLDVLHVERAVFCRVVPMLLANVAKIFCLYELNVMSAVFLLTVVFGVSSRQALGALDILIIEV